MNAFCSKQFEWKLAYLELESGQELEVGCTSSIIVLLLLLLTC